MIFNAGISSLFAWKYLIVFLTGIIFGFFFVMLIYLYAVVASLRKKKKYGKNTTNIEELEIELLIEDAETLFKDKEARKEVGVFAHFKNVSHDLVSDIAKKYYPTSKYPLLELSVEESLDLSNYISNRINEFLSARILAPLKRRTLAQIKSIYDVKAKVEETKIVKVSKKINIGKIGKTVMGIINIINPAYWIKRLTVDRLYDIIIVKICLASIGVVGEESYKIYSKSVFKDSADILDIDQLYEELIIKGEGQ